MMKPALVNPTTNILVKKQLKRHGFALVSTITVMMLLLMIGLGVISLSTISSKGATQDRYAAEAQANARLALSIAIGQLQKHTGPDQRVTATASIFDSDPSTLPIEGVNNQYAVGAWSTMVMKDGEPSDSIIYQDSDGYHSDRRNPSDSDPLNHKEQILTWLISGADENGYDPRTSELNEGVDAVNIGYDNDNKILAPIVLNKDTENKVTGGYAYHVTDLGLAAPLIQYNKNLDKEPNASSVNDGGYSNLYTGKKRQYDKLAETSESLSQISSDDVVKDKELTNRYITYGSVAFDPDGAPNDDAKNFLHNYSQQYTDYNRALFVDTLKGDLKVDLSSYILDKSQPGLGKLSGSNGTLLDDSTPVIGHSRFRAFSPKFGILRDYMNLGRLAGSSRTVPPRAPLFGGGANQDYPDPTNYIKTGLHPFIVEYSFHARPFINTSSTSKLSLCMYPRVTLWNPYNVTIDTAGYFFQINQRGYFVIETNDPEKKRYGFTGSYWGNIKGSDGARARTNYLFFFLEPVKIEPGQSLVFTPKFPRQKIAFRDGNIQNNILSAASDPSDLNCFYVDMGGPAADTSKNLSYKFLRYWQNGYHIGYEESTSARLRLSKGPTDYDSIIADSSNGPNYPIVHTMDIHNWYRGNEGRWHDINRRWEPLQRISQSGSIPPDNRTKLGIRLKSFAETAENTLNQEKAMWDFPLIEESNLRAPIYRRTPWDWIEGVPTVLHEFHFGPFASDNQEQPGYLDPFMAPRYLGDLAESSPFMNTSLIKGDLRYTLFDIPPADINVFSIGQLRQVPLSHEFSAPSFIIGESKAPVTAPREHSAFPVNEYSKLWWTGLNRGRVPNYSTWWQADYDPNSNYAAFDYRYETNLALWDKYFFSTLPEGASLTDYREIGSLPNPNIIVVDDSDNDITQPSASSADKIAENLRLQNHHSVNSTNIVAWKALLTMNMGMKINGQDTEESSIPFPGASTPLAGGGSPKSSTDELAWKGYRELTTEEVDLLAERIVEQVKRRAPFISLSDFVNRRLYSLQSPPDTAPTMSTQTSEDLLSYAGSIEVAIQQSALNAGFRDYQTKSGDDYSNAAFKDDGFDTINMANERYANAPAHLTQGKILETIGAQLTPRSDTFKIRCYGEARDSRGRVMAKAWCEAVIQRTAKYVDSTSDSANVAYDSLTSEINKTMGRKYHIISFRWLNSEEL
ncbi:hypothetical protein Rhal01_00318 [Rubritalea halochordaticola]|uniref:Verru_Chthon cassette protein A n=1 Tax=Rubritalea halochordaticola TaxID=714537 RepID=A0ABP9UUS6_9BACT